MRGTRLLPATLGTLLALSACTAGGDDPAATTAPTTTPPAPTESAAPTDEASSVDAGCLEGDWLADAQAAESLDDVPGLDGSTELAVTGDVVVTFAGGAMTTTYDDQTTTIRTEVQGAELVIESVISGSAEGTYTLEGDRLTMSGLDVTSLDIDQTTSVDGQEVDAPLPDLDQLVGSSTAGLDGTVVVTCEGDTLTLTPEGEGSADFAQTLTRR